MNTRYTVKPPWWFWLISVLGLAWNAVGIAAYLQQTNLSVEDLEALDDAQQILLESTPLWADIAFACAVFGGAIGCLLLLFRRAGAFYPLLLSLIAVGVQMYHAFVVANSYEIFGPGGLVMPVMVIIIAVLLLWFAHFGERRGWLK